VGGSVPLDLKMVPEFIEELLHAPFPCEKKLFVSLPFGCFQIPNLT
jgi:hypothetical protein